jgi:glycosyltransferase involved in cell wall biosynthesis
MNVHVTLYNAENMIKPCLEHAMKVFPDLVVHDFGSEDDGPRIATKLTSRIEYHGRLNGEDYVKLKEDISVKSEYVLWIDADEVWPTLSLIAVINDLGRYNVVNGYWKNLKVRDGKMYMSELMHRGAVAWKTTDFKIHREWPWEKLDSRSVTIYRKAVETNDKDVFCYHGVLLNISSLPDKKNRWKKRANRDDESKDRLWEEIPDLPFLYTGTNILEQPKFSWYK